MARTGAAVKNEIEDLREKLRHHEYRYYVRGRSGNFRRGLRPPDGQAARIWKPRIRN